MSGLQEKITVQEDTGIVHIPVVARSSPGHPRGTFKLFACDLDDGINKHMCMMPGKENIIIEFTLKTGQLKYRKSYKLSMRYQTTEEQPEPLQLKIKRGKSDSPVLYEMPIPLPNTQGKWETMEPIPLDVELGGSPDTLLEFVHPKPAGKGILIRDFSLVPLSADEVGEYSTQWFCQKIDALKKKVQADYLPDLDQAAVALFGQACQEVTNARKKEEQCKDDKAKKALAEAHISAKDHCSQTAAPLLDVVDQKLKTLQLSDCKELMQCIILTHAMPDRLADYCAKGKEQSMRIQTFLDSTDQMFLFLKHGGARAGCYPKALEIYKELQTKQQTGKSVFPRLALACALELCDPLPQFDRRDVFVDPIARYLHYEQAYLDRELDPAFETFSTWELRHVVNSEAPDEELAWCREMIRNYNPHIATMDDMHWRYSWITRSDCHYKQPEWPRSPRTYMDLVSGGGMCGPRAWLSRFACRAFGHPVWGVRQKGHAAVLRWEPNGWNTALGCGIDGSWWLLAEGGDRRAKDFVNETKIRKMMGDAGYLCRAELLDYFGMIQGEKRETYVHTGSLWYSLALMQRERLSSSQEPETEIHVAESEVFSKITELQQQNEMKSECITVSDNGCITIPAAARSNGNKAKFMKSYLGGMQVYLKGEDCGLVFKIPKSIAPVRKTYQMTVRVVTIHENDPHPLLVTAENPNDDKMAKEYSISLPYTVGKWAYTAPVEVELGGEMQVLKLRREGPVWAFTLKDLKLTPCDQ